LIMWKIKI